VDFAHSPVSRTASYSDYAAVVNGLKLPWSTGPVEGTVTNVKLIKRAGFGRASTLLPRRRLISAG
jgi:transposase